MRTPTRPSPLPLPEIPAGTDAVRYAAQLADRLAALGPVNPLALEELSALEERHQELDTQVADVRTARRELQEVVRALDAEIMETFAAAAADVNEHFSALVAMLFPGGTGRLTLTEPEDLLNTGIEVEVRPAGRNVRRVSLLSGGERSLAALAFLFAVFRSRPVALLPHGRGRGGARRRQPPPLLGPRPRVPRRGPAHHREPPEADDGDRPTPSTA